MSIYKAIHDNLVNSRKHLKEEWKPVHSGLERHRILPAHQGGKYTEDNCTYLTHREHIIAHWLLWKLYRNVGDKYAANGMKDGWSFEGRQHSLETREKMSKRRIGTKLSNDTKRKISEANKGREYKSKYSHEHISRMRKKYVFLDPHGKITHIENLSKFCRENNLSQSKMHNVYTCTRTHHKGWKVV